MVLFVNMIIYFPICHLYRSGNAGSVCCFLALHFQMEYKDKTIDPKPILDYINEVIRTVKGQISQQIDNELRRK